MTQIRYDVHVLDDDLRLVGFHVVNPPKQLRKPAGSFVGLHATQSADEEVHEAAPQLLVHALVDPPRRRLCTHVPCASVPQLVKKRANVRGMLQAPCQVVLVLVQQVLIHTCPFLANLSVQASVLRPLPAASVSILTTSAGWNKSAKQAASTMCGSRGAFSFDCPSLIARSPKASAGESLAISARASPDTRQTLICNCPCGPPRASQCKQRELSHTESSKAYPLSFRAETAASTRASFASIPT
eukprot:scaffold1954_cov268-Pinguiococcus_pyrenoidosus.AAC.235